MTQIISTDTTWTSGQVINLTDTIEIAAGVTLTIEDGVVVNGRNGGIKVSGSLVTEDKSDENIVFRDVYISSPWSGVANLIQLADVQFINGGLEGSVHSLLLRDSVFSKNSTGLYNGIDLIGAGHSEVLGNLFLDWSPLSFNLEDEHALLIENNTFERLINHHPQSGFWLSTIELQGDLIGSHNVAVFDNNFLDDRDNHISVDGLSGQVLVSGSFYENVPIGEEEGVVLDVEDDPTRNIDIENINVRAEINLNAPTAVPNRDAYFRVFDDLPQGLALVGARLYAPQPYDPDGIPQNLDYQWIKDGQPIIGADQSVYVIAPSDRGSELSVEISFKDLNGNDEVIKSGAAGPVLSLDDVPTSQLAIENSSRFGEEYFEGDQIGVDLNEVRGFVGGFIWMNQEGERLDNFYFDRGIPQSSVGDRLIFVYEVSDNWPDGSTGVYKTEFTPVIQNINDEPFYRNTVETPPLLMGTPIEGSILQVDLSSFQDEDGYNPEEMVYTWLRDGVEVETVSGDTYSLKQEDVGSRISFVVNYTDYFGTSEEFASDSAGLKGSVGPIANANDFPEGSVFVLGSLTVGQELTADTTNLSDEDGLGPFSFKWVRDSLPIDGATDDIYLLTDADVGSRLGVIVSYTDGFGTNEQVVSLFTAEVGGNDGGGTTNPSPVLSGPIQIGSTGKDIFDVDPTGAAISIQNFELGLDALDLRDFDRSEALNAFFNATSGSAILQFNDGTVLTVEGDGVSPRTLDVDDVLFASGNLSPSGRVIVSGEAVLGRNLIADVLGVSDPEGIVANSTSITWQRNGNDIFDATGATYTLTEEDVGYRITAKFSYTDKLGSIEHVTSFPTTLVLPFGQNINGTPNGEFLLGTNGVDFINALGGDDMIFGDGGDDLVNGGSGFDTAAFSGSQSSYTLQFSLSGTIINDRRISQDGTDTLINIESLHFSDGTFDISSRAGAISLSAEDFEALAELYLAYFNRAPDAEGLLYWATRYADGMELPQIAKSFFVQPETQSIYAALLSEDGNLNDTGAFVKAVYNNLLGREPDPDGGAYWANELDTNPDITPANFILAVINGAKAPTGGAEDREFLANKTDIGIYFSAIKGMSDYDDTISVMSLFDGTEESVGVAVAAMDAIYEEALDPNTGEFLMPLVGVVDDPFAIV